MQGKLKNSPASRGFVRVYRLPALSDNYIFVLHDSDRAIAAVVDPAEAQPVLDCLEQLNAPLVAILNTHHHRDHVGGNSVLLKRFPGAIVYGGAEDRGRIPGQQKFLQDGDRVAFGDRQAEVLFVPGHTRAHIAYYFAPVEQGGVGDLFCGDTLFAGGCGRLFEGTPTQMVNSLGRLRSLPDNTQVWCAHEYTLKNLQFALTVDRGNPDLHVRLQQVEQQRRRHEATIPSTIGVERSTNPFLRWDRPEVQEAVGTQDSVKAFARLRGMKEQF